MAHRLHLKRLEVGFWLGTSFLAPGLWDAFEYSVGSLGPKMHKYHNHPDLRPQVDWTDWTVFDSFLTGIGVSWFISLPVILTVVLIYLNKSSILSHFPADVVERLGVRMRRWLRIYAVLYTIIPFCVYWVYDRFATHPFSDIPLDEVTNEVVFSVSEHPLLIHSIYYIHAALFAVIALLLVTCIHGRRPR